MPEGVPADLAQLDVHEIRRLCRVPATVSDDEIRQRVWDAFASSRDWAAFFEDFRRRRGTG